MDVVGLRSSRKRALCTAGVGPCGDGASLVERACAITMTSGRLQEEQTDDGEPHCSTGSLRGREGGRADRRTGGRHGDGWREEGTGMDGGRKRGGAALQPRPWLQSASGLKRRMALGPKLLHSAGRRRRRRAGWIPPCSNTLITHTHTRARAHTHTDSDSLSL